MTEEPVNEYDARHEALEKFQTAIYELLAFGGYNEMLADWVLVAAQSHVHEDGSTGTSYAVYVPEHAPIHSTNGLLNYALLRNKAAILSNGVDSEE